MRPILSAVLAVSLAGSPVLAADREALAPGKPVGTDNANIHTSSVLLLAGVTGFAVGLALVLIHAHGSVAASGTSVAVVSGGSGTSGTGTTIVTTTTTTTTG